MITIGIDPILVAIGPLVLAWHGILTAAAVLIGAWFTARMVRTYGKGVTEDDVYSTAMWAVPGGIIGARLFHVADNWDHYASNLVGILALQDGGMAILGAIVGGLVVGVLYARRQRLPVGLLADLAAPGLIMAMIVGRVGCVLNGDSYGIPTDLPWAFVYTHPNAAMTTRLFVPGHPAAAYEILWDLVVLGVVWRLRGRLPADGMLFTTYFALYSLGRFFISFFRVNEIVLLGLQESQVVSLAILVVAIPLLIYLPRRQPRAQDVAKKSSAKGPAS